MKAAYIIGVPGSGKSSLVRAWAALPAVAGAQRRPKPFAHEVYYRHRQGVAWLAQSCQIGGHHLTFPGTDRLSMSVQPKAIEWLEGAPFPYVFGEGDRLATDGFFQALERITNGEWHLIFLDTPEELAKERRMIRAEQTGAKQNESWLAGRRTKTERLRHAWPHRVIEIDGTAPRNQQVQTLAESDVFAWGLETPARG